MGEHNNKKESFISYYNQYANAIFRYSLFRVFDRERAREIMQETFTKTWEYLNKGEEIENMRAFLYRVAHNICVNEIVHPRAYSLDEMREKISFDAADEGGVTPESGAEATMLLAKLELLKPKYKEVLNMRYIEDLPVKEIAEILDLIPNTVSVRIKRAEAALKELYRE